MVSEERVAVITGAGSGISRATALRFADNGYRIGVLDFNMGGARETVGLIEGAGGHAHAAQVNVADRAAVFGAVDQIIGEWGRIDVLVNGAGHADFVPFLELTEESIDRMLDVHLKGTIMCTQAVVPHMRDRGYGRIVCISSVGAVSGVPKPQPLRRCQVGHSWLRQGAVPRDRPMGHHHQLCRPGGHRHPHGRRHRSRGASPYRGKPDGENRNPRGRGSGDLLPRIGRGGIHHGRDAPQHRRQLHVGRPAAQTPNASNTAS